MKIQKTQRGFQFIEFEDHNEQHCILQQSSMALYEQPGTSAIWFGVGERRMHINHEQVEELLVHLLAWQENGNFTPITPPNKPKMYTFFYPETGIRLSNSEELEFSSPEGAVEYWKDKRKSWEQIKVMNKIDKAAFIHPISGDVIVVREISPSAKLKEKTHD